MRIHASQKKYGGPSYLVVFWLLMSLNIADFETSSITVESFIRGYHENKDVADWDPQLQGERVLKRKPNNKKDNNAVAVVRPLISLDISESQQSSGSPRTNRRARQTFHSNTVDEQEDEIPGHIPCRIALFVSTFLKRLTNKGKVVVTGRRVSRGAGYMAWKYRAPTYFLETKICQYLGWSRNFKVSTTKFHNHFSFLNWRQFMKHLDHKLTTHLLH